MERKEKLLVGIVLFSLLTLQSCNPFKRGDHSIAMSEESIFDKKTCIIGNTGLFNSDELLVKSALEKEQCQRYIHTGNLIENIYTKKTFATNLNKKFIQLYSSLFEGKEVILTPGNTEYSLGIQSISNELSKSLRVNFSEGINVFIFKDACLFVVNTPMNFRKGQDLWLAEKLKEQKCSLKIAIGHDGFKNREKRGPIRKSSERFIDILVKDNVDLYIAGVNKSFSTLQVTPTTFQISGSASSSVEGSDEKSFDKVFNDLGFMVLERDEKLNKGIIKLKLVDAQGNSKEVYQRALSPKGD